MEDNYKKLVYKVVSLSESGDQDEAFSEWAEIEAYQIDAKEGEKAWETCLCGKHPIFEVFVLKNRHNGKTIKVGNVCILHFREGDKLATVLRDYKKVKKNINKRLTQTSLNYMLDKKVEGFQSYNFYSARVNKKTKTLKPIELDLIKKVNQLFINFIERANLNRRIKTEPQEPEKVHQQASKKALSPKSHFPLQIYDLEEQRKMFQLIREMQEVSSFYQILQLSPFYAEPPEEKLSSEGVKKRILRAARLINLLAYIADEDPVLYETMHKDIVRVRFNFTAFLSELEGRYRLTKGYNSLVDQRFFKQYSEMLRVMQDAAAQEKCCDISLSMEEIHRIIAEERSKNITRGSLFDF